MAYLTDRYGTYRVLLYETRVESGAPVLTVCGHRARTGEEACREHAHRPGVKLVVAVNERNPYDRFLLYPTKPI